MLKNQFASFYFSSKFSSISYCHKFKFRPFIMDIYGLPLCFLFFRALLPFFKCIWLTFRRLKTHKFIECKYADTENLFKKLQKEKELKIYLWFFLDLAEKTSFLSMNFDELFAFIAQISGLLSRSGKALADNFDLHICCELYRRRNDEDFVASEWKEMKRIHRRSQTQTRNFKRHWPHRYELIDFPCSLQSFDLPDLVVFF